MIKGVKNFTKKKKTRKEIIYIGTIISLGVLVTSIVTPISIINFKNNSKEKDVQNKKDVEKVVQILEEKLLQQRTIILPGDSNGNIIADNKDKIIAKLKELIGASNLKNVSIEVSIWKDKEISTSEEEIMVKVSKGKHSKTIISSSSYFVKRFQNEQEITIDLNIVKSSLESLITKNLEIFYVHDNNKTINANKEAILSTLKGIEGYSEIDFKDVSIKIRNSSTVIPSSSGNHIDFTLVLSKNNVSIEIKGFSVKYLSLEHTKIIQKIKNKNILIAPNVSTQNQSEIQEAIKNQLQKENQTLTLNDLSKISTNLPSLTLGNKIEVTLTININSINKELIIYVEKANLLKNSNIFDKGQFGTIFQDSFGNLWAMGKGTKLQVLKVNLRDDGYVSAWSVENTQELLKNSNIIDGSHGTIFQDFFGNLWTMGDGTKLQILKVNSKKTGYVSAWTDDETTPGLLNGSNITNGNNGIIFQDSFGNLWTMGYGTKLQVLKINSDKTAYESTWSDDDTQGLLKNSNIRNGSFGTIFQDSFGNLWAMGYETKFQVLKVNSIDDGYVDAWVNNNTQGLLNDSNITDGGGGKIFQDSFGNLWTIGYGTKLQVLKINSDKTGYKSAWVNDNDKNIGDELLKNLNITNDILKTIFQDSFGNLWTMGYGTKLQVLKINSDKTGYENAAWSDNNTQGLLKNSNITNGYGGTIFQDYFGNLWAMGKGTKLQVLKLNAIKDGYVNTWSDDNTQGLLKNSMIYDGKNGTIFQDNFGNLWIMSHNQKFQVLKINTINDSYVGSWQIINN